MNELSTYPIIKKLMLIIAILLLVISVALLFKGYKYSYILSFLAAILSLIGGRIKNKEFLQ